MSGFIRNLIFHCYAPRNTLAWRGNLGALWDYREQFNGQRIIAIVTVTNDGLYSPDEIRSVFPDPKAFDFREMPNQPARLDGGTLQNLLTIIADPDPRQIVFRAHTKGAALHRPEECSARWRDSMYRACLANTTTVDESLTRFAVTGAYRIRTTWQSSPENRVQGHGVPWYFAGSFWWARHDRLFGDDRWKGLDFTCPYIGESLPGALFEYEDSCCLFWDNWPGGNDNDPRSYGPYLDR